MYRGLDFNDFIVSNRRFDGDTFELVIIGPFFSEWQQPRANCTLSNIQTTIITIYIYEKNK